VGDRRGDDTRRIALGIGYYRATRPAPLKPLARLDVDLRPDVMLPTARSIMARTWSFLRTEAGSPIFRASISMCARWIRRKGSHFPELPGRRIRSFSPDGKWIGFFTANKLKKIDVDGGAPADLSDVSNPRGGSWAENGMIVSCPVIV
jgi:hypothetical protein